MSATYPGETSSDQPPPHALVRAALRVESAGWLDPLTRLVAPAAHAVTATPRMRDFWQGRWLGHSAHPFFVAVPLGMWTGVTALDVLSGVDTRRSRQQLTGLGILFALPSAASGLAEWTGTNPRDRRTATAHAMINSAGLACYTRSWLARRRGRHGRGAVLAAVGYTVVSAGGFLGGHLTEGRKVGSHHPAIASD